jgi:integrase
MPHLRTRATIIPAPLRGWTIVDDSYRPRFWATVWVDVLNAAQADSTKAAAMAAVDRFYSSASDQFGGDRLDRAISAADFDTLEDALSGFLSRLKNESMIVSVDREVTWRTALTFVNDVMTHLGTAAGSTMSEISTRLQRLSRLYSQIKPSAPKTPAPIRALPAAVVEELYDIFNPESDRNPFRSTSQRWRNYLIFIVLLHMGLRRGELLLLAADAVNHDFDLATDQDRYWINIAETPYEDEDTRYSVPSIKTEASWRQLPISRDILSIIGTYVREYRGKAPHPFLLNSQHMKPLSPQSVGLMFNIVSTKLSARSLKLLADNGKSGITAHDLRHTAAVVRLARFKVSSGDLDTAIGKLRVFFGWSDTSSMPRHYARAYFETKLAEVWEEHFDSYVETLRGMKGIES